MPARHPFPISHVKHIVKKTTKLFNNLCRFVKPTWGVHRHYVDVEVGGVPAVTRKFKLARTCSVLLAELYAITQALNFANQRNHTPIRIHSDSQSALKAIQDRSNTDPLVLGILQSLHQLKAAHRTISFIWTKAHVNIVGNELADAAAKLGATMKTATSLHHFPQSHAKQSGQSQYELADQSSLTKLLFP